MLSDEPSGTLGDEPVQSFKPRVDVILAVNPLAYVVQQCRQQKFLVIRQLVARSSNTCRLW